MVKQPHSKSMAGITISKPPTVVYDEDERCWLDETTGEKPKVEINEMKEEFVNENPLTEGKQELTSENVLHSENIPFQSCTNVDISKEKSDTMVDDGMGSISGNESDTLIQTLKEGSNSQSSLVIPDFQEVISKALSTLLTPLIEVQKQTQLQLLEKCETLFSDQVLKLRQQQEERDERNKKELEASMRKLEKDLVERNQNWMSTMIENHEKVFRQIVSQIPTPSCNLPIVCFLEFSQDSISNSVKYDSRLNDQYRRACCQKLQSRFQDRDIGLVYYDDYARNATVFPSAMLKISIVVCTSKQHDVTHHVAKPCKQFIEFMDEPGGDKSLKCLFTSVMLANFMGTPKFQNWRLNLEVLKELLDKISDVRKEYLSDGSKRCVDDGKSTSLTLLSESRDEKPSEMTQGKKIEWKGTGKRKEEVCLSLKRDDVKPSVHQLQPGLSLTIVPDRLDLHDSVVKSLVEKLSSYFKSVNTEVKIELSNKFTSQKCIVIQRHDKRLCADNHLIDKTRWESESLKMGANFRFIPLTVSREMLREMKSAILIKNEIILNAKFDPKDVIAVVLETENSKVFADILQFIQC